MNVLLDSCVSVPARDVVRRAGHDLTWAGDWPRAPGDEHLLRTATAESRVRVTIDIVTAEPWRVRVRPR